MDDDDIDPADAPRPRTQRSGSDSIVDEVRKLRDDEERKGGGGDGSGSGGLGIGRAETGGTSAPAPGSGKREACMGVGEIFSVPSSVEMLRGFEELHRELFRPLVMSPSSLRPENRRNNIETELDYYAFFERQFQRRNPTATATTEDGKKCVVEKFEEVRSFTGPDGVTKSRRVEVKKFSDGSEERREKEGITMPPPSGGGRN